MSHANIDGLYTCSYALALPLVRACTIRWKSKKESSYKVLINHKSYIVRISFSTPTCIQ